MFSLAIYDMVVKENTKIMISAFAEEQAGQNALGQTSKDFKINLIVSRPHVVKRILVSKLPPPARAKKSDSSTQLYYVAALDRHDIQNEVSFNVSFPIDQKGNLVPITFVAREGIDWTPQTVSGSLFISVELQPFMSWDADLGNITRYVRNFTDQYADQYVSFAGDVQTRVLQWFSIFDNFEETWALNVRHTRQSISSPLPPSAAALVPKNEEDKSLLGIPNDDASTSTVNRSGNFSRLKDKIMHPGNS